MVFGKQICFEGWKRLKGINDTLLYKARKSFENGNDNQFSPSPEGKYTFAKKTCAARAWLKIYVGRYGEKMPQRNQIHLPSYLTKNRLHKAMTTDFQVQGDSALGYSRFCRLWKQEFSNVVIPQVS